MIDALSDLVRRLRPPVGAQTPDETERHLAIAALLVRTATIDDNFDPSEIAKLKTLFEKQFGLSPSQAGQLLAQALTRESKAVDLFGFTKVITKTSDEEARRTVVGLMWDVVYADGVVHEYEANLVWRAAELIGVSRRDRIALRQQAERRREAGGE